MNRREEGAAGETCAAEFLQKRGYRVVETNFRTKFGEIDLIAFHEGTLVFIEVKMRASAAFGAPAEAVTAAKLNKIKKVAACYLARKKSACPFSFEVVSILKTAAGPQFDVIPVD